MKTLLFDMLFISFPLVSSTNGPNARRDTASGAVGAGLGVLAGNMIGSASDRRHYRPYY